MVAPRLSLPAFIDLALALKTDAIEIRNDLKGVEIEDGMPPARVRELCEARGIKVLSINALYPSMCGTKSAAPRPCGWPTTPASAAPRGW